MVSEERLLLGVSIIERVCSVFSLLACLFIILTFCLSKGFHKPINRLVFYASFGNMLSNVATLISRSYVDQPTSPSCQAQAFLIQMFMPADALWNLAMAANVYLTFYFRFDTHRLQRIEPIYLACCYGIPAVPAVIYLWAKDGSGHQAYGDARLWCWISDEWNTWRITTFYGPVWVVILVTFFIYGRAGRTIYKRRKQLLEFDSSALGSHHVEAQPAGGNTKVTEVTVTTETTAASSSSSADPKSPVTPSTRDPLTSYSISISASSHGKYPQLGSTSAQTETERPAQPHPPPPPPARPREKGFRTRADNAAWQYAKCALLFFAAMLITWIPSSANRVHWFLHGRSSVPLEYMSAFVLPLQGVWNAIIYITTSWEACRSFLSDVRLGKRPDVTEIVGKSAAPAADGGESGTGNNHRLGRINHKSSLSSSSSPSPSHWPGPARRHHDSESTASLAGSSKGTYDQWSS